MEHKDKVGMELDRLDSRKMESVGKRIRTEREKLGIKQIELAGDLGVERNVMYKIEHGKGSLSVEYLYLISQSLGKSMDFFVTGNECYDRGGEDGSLNLEEVREADRHIAELLGSRSLSELRTVERVLKAMFEWN